MLNEKEILLKLKTLSILLIEDDERQLKDTYELLSFFFSDIQTASNYEDAIIEYKKKKFSIVFSDIMLGDNNGLDLVKQLKEIDKDIIIIVCSSYTKVPFFKQAIQIGVLDYLIKPFTFAELKDVFIKAGQTLIDNGLIHIVDNIYYDKTIYNLVINNQYISLTNKEVLFINLIINNKNRVITYEMINDEVYQNQDLNITSIKNLIYRLRKKTNNELLINVSEIGYRVI